MVPIGAEPGEATGVVLWIGRGTPTARAKEKRAACSRRRARIGRDDPRRRKRVRHARSRPRRSRSTTKPRRRRARRCAQPPCAERWIHHLLERLPQSSRRSRASGEPLARPLGGFADAGTAAKKLSTRFAGSCPIRASPPLFGPDRLARRRSPRLCPMAGSSPGPSIGCGSRTSAFRSSISKPGGCRRPMPKSLSPRPDGRLWRGAAGDLPGAASARSPAVHGWPDDSSNSMP